MNVKRAEYQVEEQRGRVRKLLASIRDGGE